MHTDLIAVPVLPKTGCNCVRLKPCEAASQCGLKRWLGFQGAQILCDSTFYLLSHVKTVTVPSVEATQKQAF
jgi:hypothetical protein